jgi:2-hydroxychromene-2-carboxylate isomerase
LQFIGGAILNIDYSASDTRLEIAMTQIEVFYSYACHDTYKVFKWLQHLEQGEALEITWSPFAVEIPSEQEWQQPWESARSELRGFMAAEAARQQGAEAFRRFHQQLEQAVHETYVELGDESTLINAAVQAGLDMEQFQAVLRSDSLARAAQQSHQRGGKYFNVFGTPTLVFCGSHSVYLELGQLIADNNTLSLFQMVKAFALEQPQVVQLKRTTSS